MPDPRAAARSLDWARVVATAVVLTMAGWAALYMHSYEPRPITAQEWATLHRHALGNCGAGVFDVVPHDQHCARYDAVSLVGGDFTMTLHDDGRAVLDGVVPDGGRGRFYAPVSHAEFRELSNLVAIFKLDRRGAYVPPSSDAFTPLVRAGCKDHWTVVANTGGREGEVEGIAQCLADFRNRADWSTR